MEDQSKMQLARALMGPGLANQAVDKTKIAQQLRLKQSYGEELTPEEQLMLQQLQQPQQTAQTQPNANLTQPLNQNINGSTRR